MCAGGPAPGKADFAGWGGPAEGPSPPSAGPADVTVVFAVGLTFDWDCSVCSASAVIGTALAVKTVSSRLLRRSAKRRSMRLAKACLTAQVSPAAGSLGMLLLR